MGETSKKKIAVVFNCLGNGGADKSLGNFLSVIDTKKYDVTLFTIDGMNCRFLQNLKEEIKVISTESNEVQSITAMIKSLHFLSAIKIIILKCIIHLSNDFELKLACSFMLYPKLPGEYDCALAYRVSYEDLTTILYRINASKKCVMLHNEKLSLKNSFDSFIWKQLFSKCDCLFGVSEACKNWTEKKYPCLRGKVRVLHNIIDVNDIINKSNEPIEFDSNAINIVTVGRLCPGKGQHMIPKVTKILADNGYDIKWYLLGQGDQEPIIKQNCEKYKVNDKVLFCGNQNNPYPFIKNCDIYVQTSEEIPTWSEGWCLTLTEAKILHKPIVTTNFSTAFEQITDGENGLITTAMTPEAIADKILYLLKTDGLKEKLISALEKEDFNNNTELQKLYDFIEEA